MPVSARVKAEHHTGEAASDLRAEIADARIPQRVAAAIRIGKIETVAFFVSDKPQFDGTGRCLPLCRDDFHVADPAAQLHATPPHAVHDAYLIVVLVVHEDRQPGLLVASGGVEIEQGGRAAAVSRLPAQQTGRRRHIRKIFRGTVQPQPTGTQ